MSMDQPQTRSRGFSIRSDKSGSSKGKVDLTESPEAKARRGHLWKSGTKANPNAAINEAQPNSTLLDRYNITPSYSLNFLAACPR